MQATPGGFERLESLVVHDSIELGADQLVELGDAGVDGGHGVLPHGHALIQDLRDQLTNEIPCVGLLRFLAGHAPFLHDALQQAEFTAAGVALASAGRLGRRLGLREYFRLAGCPVREFLPP